MPGRPGRASWRRNADVEPRVQGRSRRAGWFRDAEIESRVPSISCGAFHSRRYHVLHAEARVVRRERLGSTACRDQRRRHRSASKRKKGRSEHPVLPPNDNATVANRQTIFKRTHCRMQYSIRCHSKRVTSRASGTKVGCSTQMIAGRGGTEGLPGDAEAAAKIVANVTPNLAQVLASPRNVW